MHKTFHHYFQSFDATPIHYVRHDCSGKPKADLLIIHGLGEYADRYEEFPLFLSQNGIRVTAVDLRGFGKSGGPRAHAVRFCDFARDISSLHDIIKKNNDLPFFLFGHSFGGLVASHISVHAMAGKLRGLILSSPCFGISLHVPLHLDLSAKILSILYPRFMQGVPPHPEHLTHDPAVIEKYNNDPYIQHKISSRLYKLMLKEISRLSLTAKLMSVPLWIGQAGEDRVVDAAKTRLFFDSASSEDKTFRLYEGLYHEILNETDRRKIQAEILEWINRRI